MTFKKGQSGNPTGRPRGALSKRTQLAKLLEPHAEKLIEKAIQLALEGDMNAMRLCVERLIPKIRQEPIDIELPKNLNKENISRLKGEILLAVLEGQMSASDTEKLNNLMDNLVIKKSGSLVPTKLPDDPIEAARIYKEIMTA